MLRITTHLAAAFAAVVITIVPLQAITSVPPTQSTAINALA